MIVKELISLLKNYPMDMKVVIVGWVNGYDDIAGVKMIGVIEKVDGLDDYVLAEMDDTSENVLFIYREY